MSQHDEISLKGRFWNTATVNARLRSTFVPESVASASMLLAGLVGDVPDAGDEASDLATCRLMLAAIRVSEGDLVRLDMWVRAARVDPTDLIAAAEYGGELGADESSRAADLDSYLAWVTGSEGAA